MRTGPSPWMGSAVPRMGGLVAVIDRVIEGHPVRRGMNGGGELPAWMQHFRRMCYVVGHTVTLAGPVRKENRGCHAYGNCAPPEMPCFNQAPFHNACTDFCAWRPVAHRRSYFHGTALGLDLAPADMGNTEHCRACAAHRGYRRGVPPRAGRGKCAGDLCISWVRIEDGRH